MVDRTISHYKVLSELGRGGMGVVYKAEDTKLDRTVVLRSSRAGMPLGNREFGRWARAKIPSPLDASQP